MDEKTCVIYCALFAFSANVFSQSYVPEWQDTKMKVKPVVDMKAYTFNIGDVKLLDGPFTS